MITSFGPTQAAQKIQPGSLGENTSKATAEIPHSLEGSSLPEPWLCPISSDSQRRGILQMTSAEYYELVDQSGRMTRSGKRGAIDVDLAPILCRIGAKPDAWLETISRFGCQFRLAAGLLSSMRSFADRLGRRWLTGFAAARTAFAP